MDQFEVQLSKVSIMTLYNVGLSLICFLVYVHMFHSQQHMFAWQTSAILSKSKGYDCSYLL